MHASFREIESQYGLLVWICLLNGKEIARALSEHGVRQIILRMIRRNKSNGRD